MSAAVTAAIVVSAAGAAMSHQQASSAASKQKKANKKQREINKLKNLQAKRAFLRSFRQAQANAVTASVAAGVGIESSFVQGTQASQTSQKELARLEFARMNQLGGEMAQLQNQASSAQLRSNVWMGVSQVAQSFIGAGTGGGGGGGST